MTRISAIVPMLPPVMKGRGHINIAQVTGYVWWWSCWVKSLSVGVCPGDDALGRPGSAWNSHPLRKWLWMKLLTQLRVHDTRCRVYLSPCGSWLFALAAKYWPFSYVCTRSFISFRSYVFCFQISLEAIFGPVDNKDVGLLLLEE